MRQGLAHAVDILRTGIKRVAASAGVVIGDAAARLHRNGGQPVVVQCRSGDVIGAGKGGLDRLGIAEAHRKRGVVGRTVVDRRRTGANRVLGADHRRQHLVIDRDQLRRVARLRLARRDHDGDPLADIAHTILRQWRTLGAKAFGSAHVLGHRLGVERAEPVGGPIRTGQHGEHPGRLLGR